MIDDGERLARTGIVPRNDVDRALATRFSVRRFRPDPPPEDLVGHILRVAQRAPSGTNMQPWHAHVVAGATRARLSAALRAAHEVPSEHRQPYAYYPPEFFEPYLSRRRKVGWDLYGLLGIARGASARMHAQHARNFDFFDAPVGLVFTIDQRLAIGSWLDHGMFLQSVMIAARGHGLHTCPQAAFAPFHRPIREILAIPETETVVCGMALGYADENAPENRLVSERAPLDEVVTFHR
jgi:nitroreductase